MALVDQFSRPLAWLSLRRSRRSMPARQAAPQQATAAWRVEWSGDGLRLPRRLDATCYQEVLAAIQQTYPSSGADLALDLSEVEQIDMTGLFALHCIALIMRGETPPDPAYGWRALRSAADRNLAAGRQEHLKLVNAGARVAALLRANHLDRCLIIEDRPERGLPLA